MVSVVALIWDNFGPMHDDRVRAVVKAYGKRARIVGIELFGKSDTYEWDNEANTEFEKVTLFPGMEAGSAPLVWQFWLGMKALYFMFRARWGSDSDDIVLLGVLGSLAVMGTLVYGQFGGACGSRGFALWYGVATGLLIACSRRSKFRKVSIASSRQEGGRR